jgi:uncharacterized membrane protein HdeD (DUF308 family)
LALLRSASPAHVNVISDSKERFIMSRSSSTLIVLGVLAIIGGIIAIAWPGVTVLALVLLFAVYAFLAAGTQFTRAFSGGGAGPGIGHLLLVIVDVIAGIWALAWPVPTALVLVILVGSWAFVGGIFEILATFQSGVAARTRALYFIGGLISVLFGIVLYSRPGVGVVTVALLFGLFTLTYGFSQIALGIDMHRAVL